MVYDARHRRVPNWLVLGGAAAALSGLFMNAQPFGIKWDEALIGATVGISCLLPFYATGLMGAGDVKFAGALGLWAGLSALLPIWIISSALASLHAALWLILQRWPISPRLALVLFGRSLSSEGSSSPTRVRFIPYAAYLALAAAVWMVWGRQGS